MKKMYWLVPLTLLAALALAGGQAFAQNSSELYKQAVEDLQNNLDADAAEKLEQASAGEATDENLAAIRYALGYAYARQGQNNKAIKVMDKLVADTSDSVNGRYLLGVTLVRRMGSGNISRGMEVLNQLSREKSGTIGTIAGNSAARLIHTQSTIDYAAGQSKQALTRIRDLLNRFGRDPAPLRSENLNIKFSAGVYLMASGDLDGAQFEFDYLALNQPGFALANGTTLSQIRSNLYYQTALTRLKEGGKQGGEGSLKMMMEADKLGGGNTAANHHLKALGHTLAGNEADAAEEWNSVAEADPEYAARVAPPKKQ